MMLKFAAATAYVVMVYISVMAAVIACLVGLVLAIGYVARKKPAEDSTPTPHPLHTNR